MSESIKISTVLPTSAEKIYKAWLDSNAHSKFTGSKAKINPKLKGKFTAWDGYISGTNLELVPFKKIVQSWRTTEFPEDASDSRLEIIFEEIPKGTRVTLVHTQIPDGQSSEYKKGWKDFYFDPMKSFFVK
jgi:activator of HSP90 ATPase